VLDLMDWYPEAAKAFVQPAVENFAKVHPTVLNQIMKCYPESAKLFVKPAVENFAQIHADVLYEIMKKYPESVQMFVKPAIENFKRIHPAVVSKIIKHCPEVVHQFVKPVIENFKRTYPEAVSKIIEHCPEVAHQFVKPAVENFAKLVCSQSGSEVLMMIMQHYPEAMQAFAKPLAEHFMEVDRSVVVQDIVLKILKCCPKGQSYLLEPIRQYFSYIFDTHYMTQTQQLARMHYIEVYEHLCRVGHINYQSYPALQHMTRYVIELEHQEQEKGRYTFVHGHLWRYHFSQEMYTDLWNIIYGSADRFRYIRYKNPAKYSTRNFFSYIKQEQKRRGKLMNGGVNQYYTATGNQDYLLFMNYALFCNFAGSNTGYYIKENVSENPITIDYNVFMKELQLDHYLTTNELGYIAEQFKELELEHATISSYGGGLLLSFTPEMLKKCVYPCHGGGKQRTVEIADIGETADPQIILDTLRTAPEKIKNSDHIEFVCVLTHDCALIPNNGLDIYEFNAANQEKLAAWRVNKGLLMAWIQERVNRRREAQIQTRL